MIKLFCLEPERRQKIRKMHLTPVQSGIAYYQKKVLNTKNYKLLFIDLILVLKIRCLTRMSEIVKTLNVTIF